MNKLGQLQAREGFDDEDEEEDWDDDPNSRPLTAVTSDSNEEAQGPGGGSIQDEIERTRKRVSMMKFVPKKGAGKKWGMLRGVKSVLNEVNEAGKVHDEDLVQEEGMVAVCSLLANKMISNVVSDAVPKIALSEKKARLQKLKDHEHAMWKTAHADFKQNKTETVREIKVGSVEYLEMHEHDDDEEEMKGGEVRQRAPNT